MKRLSLLVAVAAAALAMFAMPAFAALPLDGPQAIERLDCTAPDFTSADFAASIVSPAVEQFTCDAALLAETGLCITQVEAARVSFAFVLGETVSPLLSPSCPVDRSPTG